MENLMMQRFADATEKSYEMMKCLDEINSEAWRKLTALQFDFLSDGCAAGIDNVQSWADKESFKDFIESGVEFTNDYNGKAVNFTRETIKVLSDSRDEMVEVFEKAVSCEEAVKTPAAKPATRKPATAKSGAPKKSAKSAA